MRNLIFFMFAFWLSSCSLRENPHFVFILPADFSGVFVVKREDRPTLDPANYSINVSASGIAVIHPKIPLESWHTASAKFSDGREIVVEPDKPESVGLRYLATNSKGESFFVLGTKSDEDRFHMNRNDRTLGEVRD
jgi:hypothetical protein